MKIIEEAIDVLNEYSAIPISFRVETRFRVETLDSGLAGLLFTQEKVEPNYVKDYDMDGEAGPDTWAKKWDISKWGVLSAFDGDQRVGGSVIAHDTKGVLKLEGRKDIAALWDLRVHPDFRRQGIGTMLFNESFQWARAKDCRIFKIETQNINVPACRFYAKQGCELSEVNRRAYNEYPDEVELIWCKEIG